jgi:dolichyl-diphosphooligosaccharide--protein glycosyltransferase
VGKLKKPTQLEESPSGHVDAADSVGMNIKSIVVVVFLMMLMLFAVHCTWVTSNAYSSPSIVLASYGHDG